MESFCWESETVFCRFFAYNSIAATSDRMFNNATLFIAVLIVAVFAGDLIRRWWRETEWKRRWRRNGDDAE